MRRLWLSVGILVGLVWLCIWSLASLRQQCERYGLLVSQTACAYASGNKEEALALCDLLESRWEAFHNHTGAFVDGSKLDAIHEHLVGLRPLIEGEHPETLSELRSLQKLIDGLYEEELPDLWHIL